MASPRHPVHPAAFVFPLMPDIDLAELAEDIRKNGLKHPVVLFEGQVLDGRNRLRACELAGVEPTFTEWKGPGSPWDYAWSVNIPRRHLTAGQKAALATKRLQAEKEFAWELDQAEKRRRENLKKGSDAPRQGRSEKPNEIAARPDWVPGTQSGNSESPKTPPAESPRKVVARTAEVSEETAKKALAIAKRDKKLLNDVAEGKVSLKKAAKESAKRKAPAKKGEKNPVVTRDSKDELGREIPDDLAQVWEDVEDAVAAIDGMLTAVQRTWTELEKELEPIAKSKRSTFLTRFLKEGSQVLRGHGADGGLKALAGRLRELAPYAVCWKCHGKGCAHCENTGVYTRKNKTAVDHERGRKAS